MSISIDILNKHGEISSFEVEEGKSLSEVLNVMNSPILFGCRTGVCGTCCVKILEGNENINNMSEEELEIVELFSDDIENIRLACQIKLKGYVKLQYVGK